MQNGTCRAPLFSLTLNEQPILRLRHTIFDIVNPLRKRLASNRSPHNVAAAALTRHDGFQGTRQPECWGALRGCSKPASAVSAGFLLHMRTKWDVTMLPNAVARTESPNWGRVTCTSHPSPTERISTECWGALRGCSKPASAVSAGFLLHMRTKWDVTMLPNAVARTEQPKLAEQHSKGAENTRPKRPFLEVSGRRKKKTLEVVNASSKFHMCSNTLQRTFCESLRKIG